jgi:peptidoglycan hydrolase-like protein with peptidoglycan-binding domain
LTDALSPSPATAEFIQLAGNIEAAEDKLARVNKLSAAELTPSVEIAAAEAQLAAARAALEATSRGLRKELAVARLDAATARVSVAAAQGKLDELHTTLEGLAAQASDDADVRQIADNLAALGYEGPLPAQVRAWQRDSGLPVTGIVGPSHLVVTTGPVHIASHSASPGETVLASSQDGGAILEFASTEKLVTLPLSVSDQSLAAVGRAVIVTLPDDANVDGTISEIGSIVTDGTIEVTIAIADQTVLDDLQIASVDVELVSASREDVLSVPVAALLARPEGGFAVEIVNGADSTVSPVKTGLFAAGRVEISGDGLIEGMWVGVPG